MTDIFYRIPIDKQAHILAGAVIALALGYFTSVWVSFAVAAAAGLAKELYDYYHPAHTVDAWDFIATGAGALAAAGVVLASKYQVLILY